MIATSHLKEITASCFVFVAVSNSVTISCNSKISVFAFFDVIVLRNVTGELAGDVTDPSYFHAMFRFAGQYGDTTLLYINPPVMVG